MADVIEALNEFNRILNEQYGCTSFVPPSFNNGLCYVGESKNLCVHVSAPGHVDVEKWVIRFLPIVNFCKNYTFGRFDLGFFLEERFDTEGECVKYLIDKRADIYKELYEFVMNMYNKDISEDRIKQLDPYTYECLFGSAENPRT